MGKSRILSIFREAVVSVAVCSVAAAVTHINGAFELFIFLVQKFEYMLMSLQFTLKFDGAAKSPVVNQRNDSTRSFVASFAGAAANSF